MDWHGALAFFCPRASATAPLRLRRCDSAAANSKQLGAYGIN